MIKIVELSLKLELYVILGHTFDENVFQDQLFSDKNFAKILLGIQIV